MYTHLVQYYETDKMGVTHHSNYIRWMEEAREVGVKEMKGIRVVLSYIMKKGDDIVCEAESTHCFMRKDGHVMRIEREMPEFSAFVSSVMQKDDSATSE